MPAALSLALLVLVFAPAGAAAQTDAPVEPPVLVPGAPAEEQPAPDDPSRPPPSSAPACDPELQACGEPCAPDVDEGCAPECDEMVCETPGGGDADDEEDNRAPSGAPGGGRREPGRTLTVDTGGSAQFVRVASPSARARPSQLPLTGAEPWQVALAGVLLLVAGLRLRAIGRGALA